MDVGLITAIAFAVGWAFVLGAAVFAPFRRRPADQDAYLAFYFFGLTLLSGIAAGYFKLGDLFALRYPDAPTPDLARFPLAVCGGALVLLFFALLDLGLLARRSRPLNIVVPRSFDRWLPGLIAIAVGGLIGTTVFR